MLNLNHNELIHDKICPWLPAEIGKLTSLKVLDLRGNQLTSLPAEIRQLTSLERLNLSDNEFTDVPVATYKLEAAGCFVIPY